MVGRLGVSAGSCRPARHPCTSGPGSQASETPTSGRMDGSSEDTSPDTTRGRRPGRRGSQLCTHPSACCPAGGHTPRLCPPSAAPWGPACVSCPPGCRSAPVSPQPGLGRSRGRHQTSGPSRQRTGQDLPRGQSRRQWSVDVKPGIPEQSGAGAGGAQGGLGPEAVSRGLTGGCWRLHVPTCTANTRPGSPSSPSKPPPAHTLPAMRSPHLAPPVLQLPHPRPPLLPFPAGEKAERLPERPRAR